MEYWKSSESLVQCICSTINYNSWILTSQKKLHLMHSLKWPGLGMMWNGVFIAKLSMMFNRAHKLLILKLQISTTWSLFGAEPAALTLCVKIVSWICDLLKESWPKQRQCNVVFKSILGAARLTETVESLNNVKYILMKNYAVRKDLEA